MAMIKKLLFTLSLCMFVGSALYAQSTIKGVVKDVSGAPLQYLQVLLKQDDKIVNMGITDDAGNYQIFGVSAGTYDISTGGTMTCATIYTEKGIYVHSSEVKLVDLKVNCSTELEFVEVIYVPPVFSQDNTTSSQKLTGDEVRKTPGRSITAALSNLGGVSSVDGRMTAVRGNRSDGQQMIIDGVRVRGNSGVTMSSVESLELIQGGIPAEFGDATSITVITTRGVGKDYHGGVELRASLEGYGQFLGAFTVSGPILKGKKPQDPARMGFLFSAEGNYDIDNNPALGGTWVAKPDVIKSITATPIGYEPQTHLPYFTGNKLDANSFKKIRVRKDAESWGFITQGKIDIMGGGKDVRGRPKNNLKFSVGGSYQYVNMRDWGLREALFNSKNNGTITENTLRLNARLTHRVKTDTAANSILKNIMYDINVSYTLYNRVDQDINHKNNFFGYGYIGKFQSQRSNKYEYKPIFLNDTVVIEAYVLDSYQSVDYMSFDPNGYLNNGNYYNPDLIPFTKNFIDYIADKNLINEYMPFDENVYLGFRALRNGDIPGSLYGRIANNLFMLPGIPSGDYDKRRNETIGAKASLFLNLQNHEIKFGLEFEKLTNRRYAINARGLWTLMRERTYYPETFPLDFSKPYWKIGGDYPNFDITGSDTLMYEIITTNLSNFDINLRNKLGIKDRESFLDIDSYDPTIYTLDLFSNYELINTGNPLISYNGFDYTGKLSNKKINLKKFFGGESDELGNYNSKNKFSIGAFEPIYLAIYLQDKFSISNLLFNVGLRLDYFNANQPVLKDPYLLKSALTVQNLRNESSWSGISFPDNVGPDWIPYVNIPETDINTAPHAIVAYRNGKIWYNKLGQEIPDPSSDLGTGGPILSDPHDPNNPSRALANAFVNYKPQWNVMPRISFSFPVSTNSLFYAHYNIVTIRPTNLQMNPIAYLLIDKYQNDYNIINNPNLRVQRSVDYEIGFRQKIGENAALNLGAYYSEKRDHIQSYRYTGAYPNTYYSYENQDFGTVQGYMLEMTMRGTKNLTFRASYTLQFAKGTGSSSQSNLAIIKSGQPNLRTLTNLDFDQRHRISATVDLRFDQGTNYNGPITVKQKKGTNTKKEIRWFENAGATILFSAASGMPYSRSSIVYSALLWGQRTAPRLQGSINGANMPWIFQCDLRIDKSFVVNLASKKDKNESGKRKNKPGMLTVYLDFANLFNIKNVQNVYQYTGSATDDGYLTSSLFQAYTSTGEIFSLPVTTAEQYYKMLVSNPYNYTQPFRVYLGVSFSF
jgi:hypothetical protein